MANSYPAEIERLMEQKGFMKQRGDGVSIDALSGVAGVHVDTVKSILQGSRSSRPKKVQAVADALGISSSKLLELAGRPDGEVYVGPAVTRSMTDRQRAALTEFLLATLDEREGEEHADGSAAIDQAAGSAAEDDSRVHHLDFDPGEQDEAEQFGRAAAPKEKDFKHDDPIDEQPL